MKYTKPFLIISLLLCCSAVLVAQHGNVAAGGDAIGSGGTMSYSVGQTDYLTYITGQGILSLGLQQVWFESTIEVPSILEVQNVIVAGNDILCFNATETVTLAGDGTYFTVESGGSAEVIAGQNILLKYGATIHSGADFHAWITTNGEYCNLQTSLLASFDEEVISKKQPLENESMGSFFKVYPNPTTGTFTIELLELEEYSKIHIELYSALGHLVFAKLLPALRLNTINIADRQPGIYLIRVFKDQEIGTTKILKQ